MDSGKQGQNGQFWAILGQSLDNIISPMLYFHQLRDRHTEHKENEVNEMTQYTVGRTILEQMGGAGTLHSMVGGTPLLMDNGLQIDFKGSRKANKVRITLGWTDTYTVTFYRYNRSTLECPVYREYVMVYAGQLSRLFEIVTGLTLRL